MEDTYDENIATNPFFLTLRRDFPTLFQVLTKGAAQLCVPKCPLLNGRLSKLSENDFRSHIITSEAANEVGWLKTLAPGKIIKLESDSLLVVSSTTEESNVKQRIPILFQETFVSDASESFRVLCLNGFISSEGSEMTPDEPVRKSSTTTRNKSELSSSQESLECFELILFKAIPNGAELKEKVVKMLTHFGEWLTQQFRPTGHFSPAQLSEVTSQQFRTIWDYIKYQRVELGSDVVTERQIELLRTGTEVIFFHQLHAPIWSILTSMLIEEDGQFNKRICDADRVTVEDLGVDSFLYDCIPAARKELKLLNAELSPHLKIIRLRKTIQAVWKGVKTPNVLAPDNLLPILIFLIIKSPIHNWVSNLDYLRRFHFCDADGLDELGYCLASFEAAVQYIDSGKLRDIVMEKFLNESVTFDFFGSPMDSVEVSDVWELLMDAVRRDSDYDVRQIFLADMNSETQDKESSKGSRVSECSFDETEAASFTNSHKTSIDKPQCHPLCNCPTCRPRNDADGHQLNINAALRGGRTALHLAAFLGKSQVLNELCELGATTACRDASGRTPLHYGCCSPDSSQKCVLLLLHHGADPMAVDVHKNSPLHLAVLHKNIDCAKALIFYIPAKANSSEIFLDQKNDQGDTPLHIAARLRYYEIVELLLQSGAKTSLYNRRGEKAVDYAEGTTVLQNLFLREFQSIPVKNSDNVPSISDSLIAGHGVRDGIEAGEDLLDNRLRRMLISEAMDESLLRRFLRAISDNDMPMVNFYLERSKASVSGCCHPLCQCSSCSLVKGGDDRRSKNFCLDINGYLDETSPLHLACSVPAAVEMVKLLIESGADINLHCGTKNLTPLHQAVLARAPIELIIYLMSRGASVSLTDDLGKTPLHYAAEVSPVEVIKCLIKHGAQICLPDRTGNTPLHYAGKGGNVDAIGLLVSLGADVAAQNDIQLTPADLAQGMSAVKLLESNGKANLADRQT